MKLYSYWRSSSAWRVRIALAWKGLDCDVIPVHLLRDGGEQHLPAFLTRNPLGQVPVLEVEEGGQTVALTQSLAILEYLEERHPHPPLLPADPLSRARVRQLAEIINSGIQPLQNLKLQQTVRAHGVDPAPVVRAFITAGLTALEEHARAAGPGRFLIGDSPTFADVLLIPQLHASRRMGVDVDVGRFPTLLRVEAECASLPAFQQARPEAQADFEPSRA